MATFNPSLYFGNVERFLKLHQDHAPLALLRNAVKSNGCPDERVDDIVNGAIKDETISKVSPKENTMKVCKGGIEYTPIVPYNPTNDELVDDISNRIEGLGRERAKGIVDNLIRNEALTEYPDGKPYRTKVLVPRFPLTL